MVCRYCQHLLAEFQRSLMRQTASVYAWGQKEMADAIKSMVGNPQIGKSKGNASREKAMRYYPDNVASELIEIYKWDTYG